ncbi:galactose mutarotase [Alkalihalobacillus oceani]|uniref:aldose epimerase family protein n=1 Tax=Halalkalibacter oceani TaxID=1653776 RepID=UPI00203EF49A|nr:aldose epimerase family protein [Halalkalibacter oceani]MCM3761937.1 galactose mutarotase [Halalkalibacter oceani]
MKVSERTFGTINGQTVKAFMLKNNNGMEVGCISYGCTITKIVVPDKHGRLENVVLGYETLEEYLDQAAFLGCVIGRVAGRIGNAEFELDGKVHRLAKNEGDHHLHGGKYGFDKVVWETETEESADELKVIFTHESHNQTEGYPGHLRVKVSYQLNNNNELTISYRAVTDQKTIVNLTNHSYFNLSGNGQRDVLQHKLTLKSDRFLPLNESLLPTGEKLDVANTPFDLRRGRRLEDGVTSHHPQNQLAGDGYDHPFILSANHQEEIRLVDEESGRELIVETDEPCVVVYTANTIGEDRWKKHMGVCLETQHHPDAVHHADFPSIVLEKDEEYRTATTYRFAFK